MTELGVRTIPGYVVHEQLEASLVDATYLASRVSDGYPVVLQVLTAEFSDDAAAATLRAAIDQVSAIRHPVIPTVWEIGEAEGLLYTISNAVEGRSLAATLTAQHRLAHDETLAICAELADALEILATAGIVHGAISPRTVWINDRHRSPSAPYVSLRGFGTTPLLARRSHAERTGPPPPDLLYVAPEQVAGEPATERTDQYALACLALHALTGVPPFDRPTIDELFSAHLSQTPDDADLHADALPPRVVGGLRRSLAKHPADRFESSGSFATAIGGTTHRSWSWMIEEAATREVLGRGRASSAEIDLRDDVGPSGGGADVRHGGGSAPAPHVPEDEHSGPPSDSERVSARSLADADWLPSPTGTGPQQPVGRPAGQSATARAAGLGELLSEGWRRWLGFALVFVAVAGGVWVVGAALLAPRSTPAIGGVEGPATGAEVREVEATWRRPLTNGPMTSIVASEEELVGSAGDHVTSLDEETGRSRWATTVDSSVSDLVAMGPIVIVRTTDGFSGLDRRNGELAWRSSDATLRDTAAFVTGRGRMFAADPAAGGGVTIHAIDPTTGEIGWSADAPDAAVGRGPIGIAYDGSERGGRSLYVTAGDRLYAFDTMTRDLRWEVPVRGPRAASLTAVGGAVLVIDRDGRLCRHDAADGSRAWSGCATLERAQAPVTMVQVRNGRVTVTTAHEVVSVDFTSGATLWRIVSEDELQPAAASNRMVTFVAAPDGTVEALAQRNGASLWESAPFGEISAMTATKTSVFVATSDGRLTLLEAPGGDDQS